MEIVGEGREEDIEFVERSDEIEKRVLVERTGSMTEGVKVEEEEEKEGGRA